MRSAPPPAPAWRTWHDENKPIRIGISSCLLAKEVRYDAGHTRDRYLRAVLDAGEQRTLARPYRKLGTREWS